MSPLEVVAILLAGMAAGTINTVVGSGTLITFPTLLAFGIPPVTANVSNTIGLVPGSLSGAIGYRARARGSADPAAPARQRLAAGRHRGSPAPAVAAVGGLRRDRAGADRARLRPGRPRSADLSSGWPPAPRRAAAWPSTAPGGCGRPSLLAGVYGGYFGAAQGVLLMAILGIGVMDSMQRHNATKNVLALLVNGVAAIVFILLALLRRAVPARGRGRQHRLGRGRADRRRLGRSAASSARPWAAGSRPTCCVR